MNAAPNTPKARVWWLVSETANRANLKGGRKLACLMHAVRLLDSGRSAGFAIGQGIQMVRKMSK